MDELYPIIRPLAKKSCFLDLIPAQLLLQSLDTLSPVILKFVNLSIESAFLPDSLKEAIIKPILKKNNLDPSEYMNFRSISNLPFVSKVIEKVTAAQLTSYVEDNNLCELFQSVYRRNHNTETALIRVNNEIAMAMTKDTLLFWFCWTYQQRLILLTIPSCYQGSTLDLEFVTKHWISFGHICLDALSLSRSTTVYRSLTVYPKVFPKGQCRVLSYTRFMHHLLET